MYCTRRISTAALAAGIAALLCSAEPTRAATPSQAMRPTHLSPNGARFWNYDGAKNYKFSTRDWPINMIFFGDSASVNYIENYYEDHQYRRTGGSMYLPVRNPTNSRFSFDSHKGRKNACNAAHNNNHMRVYGGPLDSMYDPRWGYFVVGSTHLDHGDADSGPCAASDDYFGYSEDIEHVFAQVANQSFVVIEDYKSLRNQEDPRWEGNHFWQSDGRATIVHMP